MPKVKRTGVIHDTITGYNFEVDPPLRPLKAIRAKCLECVCGGAAEVRRCRITDCPLWPYRLGKRPTTPESQEEHAAETAHESQ